MLIWLLIIVVAKVAARVITKSDIKVNTRSGHSGECLCGYYSGC